MVYDQSFDHAERNACTFDSSHFAIETDCWAMGESWPRDIGNQQVAIKKETEFPLPTRCHSNIKPRGCLHFAISCECVTQMSRGLTRLHPSHPNRMLTFSSALYSIIVWKKGRCRGVASWWPRRAQVKRNVFRKMVEKEQTNEQRTQN